MAYSIYSEDPLPTLGGRKVPGVAEDGDPEKIPAYIRETPYTLEIAPSGAYPMLEVTTMAKKMFEGDGHTRPATVEDMVPGQVIRRPNGDGDALQSFSDTVVLRETEHGWRVARPYLREHFGGWMSGVEDYEITRRDVPFFHVVMLASGEPHRMTLTPEVK